MYMKL